MTRYQPLKSPPPHVTTLRIPRGYLGTRRTVAHVRSLIQGGARDFYVRQKAIDIMLARGVRPKNYRGEIEALFEWVQRHVRYTKDPFRVEVLHSPRRMLELRAGDCDDIAILLGAMLEAIGHPVRLVLTGSDFTRPQLFSHIYLEVFCRGQWISLDATMPYPMGWAPRAPIKQVIALQEDTQHAINEYTVAMASVAARGKGKVGLASRVVARDRKSEHSSPRSESEAPLESVASPRCAGAEPLAQTSAPADLGKRSPSPTEAENDPESQGTATTFRDPQTTRESRTRRGSNARARADHYSSEPRNAPDSADVAASSDACRPARETPVSDAADSTAATSARAASGKASSGFGSAPRAVKNYTRRGEALYRLFNQHDPDRVVRVAHRRVIPPVVVHVGELLGVIYRSDKWQRGRPRTYIHWMESPPWLVSDADGTQFYVVGGNYQITERGVEG